jgi:hypothetical protein
MEVLDKGGLAAHIAKHYVLDSQQIMDAPAFSAYSSDSTGHRDPARVHNDQLA